MRIHPKLAMHPRARKLPADAIGTYLLLASYSEGNELDGLVPAVVQAEGLLKGSAEDRLLRVGLLVEVPDGWELRRWRSPELHQRWLPLGHPDDGHPLVAIIGSRAGAEADRERNKLSPGLRAVVVARDKGICGICGLEVQPPEVHIDHVLPVSLGGKTVVENLQLTHARCNLSKGARVEEARG